MLKVKVYTIGDIKLPAYETELSAGMDIRADFSRVNVDNPIKAFGPAQFLFENEVNKTPMLMLEPGSRALIPTGLKIGLPVGYECQVRPRSGLALKEGITVLNTPGTVDADYRGEIGVILINHNNIPVYIEHNERIAQLVFNKVEKVEWEEVYTSEDLGKTDRGEGGFGHTNKN